MRHEYISAHYHEKTDVDTLITACHINKGNKYRKEIKQKEQKRQCNQGGKTTDILSLCPWI